MKKERQTQRKTKRILPLWRIIISMLFGTGKGVATVTSFIIMMICYYNLEILGNLNLMLFLLTAAFTVTFVILMSQMIENIVIMDIYYNDYSIKKDEKDNE